MAESKNNVITHGLSGKLGDLIVFRNRNGKTYVASLPREQTYEPSEAQKKHQKKFQQAVLYGKSALADPATRAAYQASAALNENTYNVAVADFMHAPDIEEIDLSAYRGKVGDTIKVKATDNFIVKEVAIGIYNADGSEVEHGLAQLSTNGIDWIYTTTVNNDSRNGDKIIVQASDLPGHTTLEEKEL